MISTHILREVEAVCDRVLIINRGKIVADGFVYEGEFEPEATLEVRVTGAGHQKICIGELTDMRYSVMLEGDETIFSVDAHTV